LESFYRFIPCETSILLIINQIKVSHAGASGTAIPRYKIDYFGFSAF